MEQNFLEALVQKYEGIPYQHGGRDLDGLDCAGLAILFYKDCGIYLPDNDGSSYSPDWFRTDPDRYLRWVENHGEAVNIKDLQPLDFVYFWMGRAVTHGGVMIDERRFIHVLERTRVHWDFLKGKWLRRLAGIRRFK